MSNYKAVSEALAAGAEPAMLCETCPWDRFCITPPSMTAKEVQDATDKAKAEDEQKLAEARAEGRDGGIPMGSLLTALTLAGRDTLADVCPVLAARLRSSDGGGIVAGIRTQMRTWDDNNVEDV